MHDDEFDDLIRTFEKLFLSPVSAQNKERILKRLLLAAVQSSQTNPGVPRPGPIQQPNPGPGKPSNPGPVKQPQTYVLEAVDEVTKAPEEYDLSESRIFAALLTKLKELMGTSGG